MMHGTEVAAARRRLDRRVPGPGERPDPAKPPGTDCIPQVKHIVVLMMENHSYDNYFGMLTGHGDGLELDEHGEPVAANTTADGTRVRMRRFPGTTQLKDVPSQSWRASHLQFDEGSCGGFVRSVAELLPGQDASVPMTYWTETDLPFYYGLARTFPLATRWFGSCLGPTFPNRRFLISGTAHGLLDDKPYNLADRPERGTIFDLLTAHGISWVNYHHVNRVRANWRRLAHTQGLHHLRMLRALTAGTAPRLIPAVESKLQATASLYPCGFLRSLNHLRHMSHFWHAARRGSLPAVSIVDPDFHYFSEENPQDIQRGESFAAQVINAVMSGPAWPTTLLVWLYDEHGGYYDHVPPPAAVAPDDVPGRDPMQRFRLLRPLRFTAYGKQVIAEDQGPSSYDRLGFRVPAVVVSPYARPGLVMDTVYDHTSVLKLIETKWNLPPLTRRDAAAVAPLEALDFEAPPAFLTPPTLPAAARPWGR